MTNIINQDGQVVTTVRSDAEAVRWFLDNGHDGDRLEDTGETLHLLAGLIFEEVEFHYDATGNVVTTVHPD